MPSLQHIEATPANTEVSGDFQERYITAFRWMLLSRQAEEKLASLYRAGGKIVGGVYTGRGQEAFSAALGSQLQRGKDVFGPLIRDQAGRLAFGEPLVECVQTYFGSANGPMRGRDGNVHRGRPKQGMPAMISHLGSLVSVVSGMLFARRMKGIVGIVGATCIGDGATSTGSFHEALNLAAVEKLPLVVAVANNQFAYSTPTDRQFACEHLVDRATGYGVGGFSVDGTSLAASLIAFEEAIEAARKGGGPQLVVGDLLRLAGHGEHDDASYIPDELKQSEQGRDCLDLAQAHLLKEGYATESDLANWNEEFLDTINDAVAQASADPSPDPYAETWNALASTPPDPDSHIVL